MFDEHVIFLVETVGWDGKLLNDLTKMDEFTKLASLIRATAWVPKYVYLRGTCVHAYLMTSRIPKDSRSFANIIVDLTSSQ